MDICRVFIKHVSFPVVVHSAYANSEDLDYTALKGASTESMK